MTCGTESRSEIKLILLKVYIQGGAINRGLNFFFFFSLQCIGIHVVLKLMVAQKITRWCVLGCWLPSIQCKINFSYWLRNEWQVLRMYGIPLLAGPIPRQLTDVGLSNWREALPGLLTEKCAR